MTQMRGKRQVRIMDIMLAIGFICCGVFWYLKSRETTENLSLVNLMVFVGPFVLLGTLAVTRLMRSATLVGAAVPVFPLLYVLHKAMLQEVSVRIPNEPGANIGLGLMFGGMLIGIPVAMLIGGSIGSLLDTVVNRLGRN